MLKLSDIWKKRLVLFLQIQVFMICLNVLIALWPLRNFVPVYAGY